VEGWAWPEEGWSRIEHVAEGEALWFSRAMQGTIERADFSRSRRDAVGLADRTGGPALGQVVLWQRRGSAVRWAETAMPVVSFAALRAAGLTGVAAAGAGFGSGQLAPLAGRNYDRCTAAERSSLEGVDGELSDVS